MSPAHAEALIDAVRDGELWKLWYTSVPSPDGMRAEIARRLALQSAGSMLPFTSFDSSGQAVGMTTYMNLDPVHRRLEIGSTWTAQRMQRGPFNTECKLLLLGHAFDTLGCIALSQKEIKARLKKVKQPMPRYTSGVMGKYARHVSSASEGAITT